MLDIGNLVVFAAFFVFLPRDKMIIMPLIVRLSPEL